MTTDPLNSSPVDPIPSPVTPTMTTDLAAVREKGGLTAAAVAEKLDVSLRTVQRWEAGETRCDPITAQRYRLACRDLLYERLREVTKETLAGASALLAYEASLVGGIRP